MKIALLTFHNTSNFGALLQTYGLYKTLREVGMECEVLDYQCEAIKKREMPRKSPANLTVKGIISFLISAPVLHKRYQKINDFLNQNIKLSRYYDRENIAESEAEYDAFLVGSDILWGFDITGGDTAYFLDFIVERNKKFAFSTSIGSPWDVAEKEIIKPLLNDFQRISVRESYSVPWLSELTNQVIQAVCDPTMLVSKEEWNALAERSGMKRKLISEKYVLTYFADAPYLRKAAQNYADRHGFKVYSINYGLPKRGLKCVRPLYIEDFLCLLKSSQAVFTASYHGMLFALYFERELYYYNIRHSARFDSVAEKLGITARCGVGRQQVDEAKMDYEAIGKLIMEWRKESLCILRGYWEKQEYVYL